MSEQEPVDAATYAAHLERLDRIGREALAADPAEAIMLVREANELVAELLPMHRSLMDELADHRETLQAACDELAEEAPTSRGGGVDAPDSGGLGDGRDTSSSQLDRLEDLDDGEAPF